MLNILRKISLLAVIALLTLIGCSNNLNESGYDFNEPEESGSSFSIGPIVFDDEDELFAKMGMLKFSEFDPEQIPNRFGTNFAIEEMVEFFRPGIPPQAVEWGVVSVVGESRVSHLYYGGDTSPHGATEHIAHFHWVRGLPLDLSEVFGRGAMEERIEEHNGITYYISILPP